jgi:hypothetical protein
VLRDVDTRGSRPTASRSGARPSILGPCRDTRLDKSVLGYL